jgi:hypothetical protein
LIFNIQHNPPRECCKVIKINMFTTHGRAFQSLALCHPCGQIGQFANARIFVLFWIIRSGSRSAGCSSAWSRSRCTGSTTSTGISPIRIRSALWRRPRCIRLPRSFFSIMVSITEKVLIVLIRTATCGSTRSCRCSSRSRSCNRLLARRSPRSLLLRHHLDLIQT